MPECTDFRVHAHLISSITPIPTEMLFSLLYMYIHGYLGAAPIPYVQGTYLSTTILVDVGIGQGHVWFCQFSTDEWRLR